MFLIRHGLLLVILTTVCTVSSALDMRYDSAAEVARVEEAYSQSLARASTPSERLDAALVRADSLNMVVEFSYEATLAWLMERNGRLGQVQQEQNLWLDKRAEVIDQARNASPDAAKEEIDLAARMTIRRLDQLENATSLP